MSSLSRKLSDEMAAETTPKRPSLTAIRDQALKRLESFENGSSSPGMPRNQPASNSSRQSPSPVTAPSDTSFQLSPIQTRLSTESPDVMSPILSQLPASPVIPLTDNSKPDNSQNQDNEQGSTSSLENLEAKSSNLTHLTTNRAKRMSRVPTSAKNPARAFQEISNGQSDARNDDSDTASIANTDSVSLTTATADKQEESEQESRILSKRISLESIGFKLPAMIPGGVQLKRTSVANGNESGVEKEAATSPVNEVDKIRAKLRSVSSSIVTAEVPSKSTVVEEIVKPASSVKEQMAIFSGGSQKLGDSGRAPTSTFSSSQLNKREEPVKASVSVKDALKSFKQQESKLQGSRNSSTDNLSGRDAKEPVNLSQMRSQLKQSGSRIDLSGNLVTSKSELGSSRDGLSSSSSPLEKQQQVPEFLLMRNKLRSTGAGVLGDSKSSQLDLSSSRSLQPSPTQTSPVSLVQKSASASASSYTSPTSTTQPQQQGKWSITPSAYNKPSSQKTTSSAYVTYQAPIVSPSTVTSSSTTSTVRLDDSSAGQKGFSVNLKATKTDQFVAAGGGAVRHKEPMLWVIKGKRRLLAQKITVGMSSINQADPMILDMPPPNQKQPIDPEKPANRLLYVVSGTNSSKVRRTKAIEIANLMKDFDYSGKADIHLVEMGNIKERSLPEAELLFWQQVLGSDNLPSKSSIIDAVDKCPLKMTVDDESFESTFDSSAKLTIFENGSSKLAASDGKELKRGLLSSTRCAVLECTGEIYIWAGKASSETDRQSALSLAEDLCKRKNLVKFLDGEKFERTTFKLKFEDWQAGKELSVYNVLEVKQAGNIKAKDKEWRVYDRGSDVKKVDKVDIAKMYDKNSSTGNDVAKNTEALDIDPAELAKKDWGFVNLRAWTVFDKVQGADKSAKIAITPAVLDSMERKFDSNAPLTLYSQECYIFLYEYKERPSTMTDTVLTERLKFTKEDLVGQMKESILLYAWIGAESSVADQGVMAHIMLEIEKHVKTSRGAPAKGRHLRVIEGKESTHFLNMIRGGNIPRDQPKKILDMIPKAEVPPCPVVACRRSAQRNFNASDSTMYHVSGSTADEVRVTQSPEINPQLLCSAHCYVIVDGNSVFVWNGRGSFEWERESASRFAKEVILKEQPSARIVQIQEGAETSEFWKALHGSSSVERSNESFWSKRSSLPTSWTRDVSLNSTQGSSDKAPYDTRIWKINHFINGNPTATEITPFAYSDLEEDCVFILDAYFQLFVWIGATIGRNKTIENDSNEPEMLKKVPTERIEAKGAASGFKDLKLALQTAARYADFISEREQGRLTRSQVFVVQSGSEPPIFKSHFPYWRTKTIQSQIVNEWKSGLMIDDALFHFEGKKYPASQIKQYAVSRIDLPFGLDLENLEKFLSADEFVKIFGMDAEQFSTMPQWKQIDMKKKLGFF